jgi:hypothetical protein
MYLGITGLLNRTFKFYGFLSAKNNGCDAVFRQEMKKRMQPGRSRIRIGRKIFPQNQHPYLIVFMFHFRVFMLQSNDRLNKKFSSMVIIIIHSMEESMRSVYLFKNWFEFHVPTQITQCILMNFKGIFRIFFFELIIE